MYRTNIWFRGDQQTFALKNLTRHLEFTFPVNGAFFLKKNPYVIFSIVEKPNGNNLWTIKKMFKFLTPSVYMDSHSLFHYLSKFLYEICMSYYIYT